MAGAGRTKSLKISKELNDSDGLRELPTSKVALQFRDPLLFLRAEPCLRYELCLVERVDKKLRECENLLIEFRLRDS
jgi:hypothetical protein